MPCQSNGRARSPARSSSRMLRYSSRAARSRPAQWLNRPRELIALNASGSTLPRGGVRARLQGEDSNDQDKIASKAVIDIAEESWGTWRHSATKYLKGPKLRDALRRLCGREGA
jgi:hypothetical protein